VSSSLASETVNRGPSSSSEFAQSAYGCLGMMMIADRLRLAILSSVLRANAPAKLRASHIKASEASNQ
jgi:hypothetical protein